MDLHGFDANAVEPQQSMEPLPAGWYRAVITASEEKPTKAQTGSFLMMTLEVIEGQHQGRKVFERLNLNNPNATAVEIAQRTLSSICRAVGVMTPRNSSDLHDKPFMVKLAVKPADGQYSASNDIKEYAAQDKAPAGAAAPAASSSTPPWKRG
jgi:hypothetical protein